MGKTTSEGGHTGKRVPLSAQTLSYRGSDEIAPSLREIGPNFFARAGPDPKS